MQSKFEALRAAYRAATASSQPKPVQPSSTGPAAQASRVTGSASDPPASLPVDEFHFPLFDQLSSSPGNARPPEFSRQARKNRQIKAALFPEVDNELFEDLPPHPETLLVKLLSRPRQVALVIGLCMLASGIYAVLGCWWLLTRPVAHATEPVSMLSLQEADGGASPKAGQFIHIQEIQAHPDTGMPQNMDAKTDPNRNADPSGTLLAQADAPMQSPAGNAKPASKPSAPPELTGRPDPFAPLIQENPTLSSIPTTATAPQKKDVLEDLQYTGFIGNINAKNRLAVIKVYDASGSGAPQTLIKKIGDAFTVDGERIVLKGIAKQTLLLSVAGHARFLSLAPYQETVASAPSGSGATGSSAATAAGAGGAQAGAVPNSGAVSGASSKLGNLNALGNGPGAGSGSPNGTQLQESEFP